MTLTKEEKAIFLKELRNIEKRIANTDLVEASRCWVSVTKLRRLITNANLQTEV